MYRSYYPDEPVSFSLKFRCDPKLDQLAYEALDESLSVVIKCKYSGDIIAASINQTTNSWDANLLDRLACTLCSKGKHILHMRAHLMRTHDLWNYYHVQKIFDVSTNNIQGRFQNVWFPILDVYLGMSSVGIDKLYRRRRYG